MLRFIARTTIALIANAVGLIVAAWVLDDMSLSASGFIIDVLIFTAVAALIGPFIAKSSMKGGSALVGASAILAAFVALVVTALVTDSLKISGGVTWLLATMIIWGVSLLATLLLPLFLFKRWLADRR